MLLVQRGDDRNSTDWVVLVLELQQLLIYCINQVINAVVPGGGGRGERGEREGEEREGEKEREGGRERERRGEREEGGRKREGEREREKGERERERTTAILILLSLYVEAKCNVTCIMNTRCWANKTHFGGYS